MAEDGYIMTNKAWCAKQNNGRSSRLSQVTVDGQDDIGVVEDNLYML